MIWIVTLKVTQKCLKLMKKGVQMTFSIISWESYSNKWNWWCLCTVRWSRTTIWIADMPLFYDMFAKVLYLSLTFSLTVLHHKTAAFRSPKICLSCFVFFYLCLAPMRTNKIFTFWTRVVQFRFEGIPHVPRKKGLYYYTWLESW